MKLLMDFQRTMSGFFLKKTKLVGCFETRAERKARVRAERRKQLEDSFNSVGSGYHEAQGWFK